MEVASLACGLLCETMSCIIAGWCKSGKNREFDIRQGKVGEIVVCLWCATAVVIVTK